jgi:hypothetical protein
MVKMGCADDDDEDDDDDDDDDEDDDGDDATEEKEDDVETCGDASGIFKAFAAVAAVAVASLPHSTDGTSVIADTCVIRRAVAFSNSTSLLAFDSNRA